MFVKVMGAAVWSGMRICRAVCDEGATGMNMDVWRRMCDARRIMR